MVIYGIKNCDTCKKALKWLDKEGIPHQFHDLRKDGFDQEMAKLWLSKLDHDVLINKRGTTYRNLEDSQKEVLETGDQSSLLVELPTLMKRPIFKLADEFLVGFKDEQKARITSYAKTKS
ncbi:Spx/MgsR family RNA polymerase-binding regulatory protein [Sneathiella marina]|uniref:Spx/MgsR family RNA polymerase-binding regulatory protein n=1 Tax=Sneathiella marina TaxID=2950108 RepID=A0ABY4W3I0_9PROT|nr:Spx/MgsR family RNA polymerase-binding regulatory protein [Sneathiella marina]USG59854.1 Spx/MgsR family RNA polymerase-binding regulatory protein [Sneathiella marina]